MLPTVPGENDHVMSTPRPARPGRARRALLGALGAVVLVAAVGTSAPPPAPAQEGTSSGDEGAGGSIDVAALRHEYEELVGEEADLLVDYDLSTARLEELYVQVAEAQDATDRADLALVAAEADLAGRREAETAADAALVAAEEEVVAAERRVRLFAVGAYMGEGTSGDLSAMLETLEGEHESLVRRGYRRSVDDQQGHLIDLLVEARIEHERLQGEARLATRRAQEQRDAVDRLRSAAAAALEETTRLTREASEERDRQATLILDIQSRKVSMEARIVNLDRAADGIEGVLAGFQAGDPPWTPGAIHFSGPLPCTPIGSEFGMRSHPILGYTRLHAGADISASTGEPVHAAADGIVLLAEARGGYGNTVVVAHGFSLGTVYAHNSQLLVQPGQQVKRGDVVALAGSTGLSTGPHVHFETRIKGEPVNPRNFLLPVEGGTGLPGPAPVVEPERPDLSTTTTTTQPIGTC